MNEETWNWTKFIKGFINKKFIAWAVSSSFVIWVLYKNIQTDTIKLTLIIAWGAISVIWMLAAAWEKLIENGKLNIEAKVGASIEGKVNADTAKIIEATKNTSNGGKNE